jgi:cysteine desulfurase
LKNLPKYYDAASTTPVDPRVLEAMLPYFSEIFGNASSNHIYGKQAKRAIDIARRQVANIINADPNEIYFTSGATEAINWAIKGYLEANPEKGNHIITVKTEHKAVLNTCEHLESKGYEVTYLDVDQNGLINLQDLENKIQSNTALIAVMYVNNEIGIIQDIPKIGEIARDKGIAFFCDATQAVGKIPVDVVFDRIDMLCLSAHKFNGPKGIGALYIGNGIKVNPLIHGGGQEDGLRAGTYNTPLIVGLGEACRIIHEEFNERIVNLIAKRSEIENYFEDEGLGTVNFTDQERAPHIISITLKNRDAEDFLIEKNHDFSASTGSACNSNIVEISHVIKALNIELDSQRFLRISFTI